MLQYIVARLEGDGFGPFYIHTDTGNTASIRGMVKAGFACMGVWKGYRLPLGLHTRSERVE
jgi:hypothetical protein